ncbi:MAG: hypothetical protein M3247_04250 [Thermoproteota archaeon]|nr:hypothetical protein [Thermoproteota archaeon]HYY50091.1 hypothetical protein [Nitrososphaeraceae archaeon]
MTQVKVVSIFFPQNEIPMGHDIHGTINIDYPRRFDSIVINSQIENSNDILRFSSLNQRRINYPYGRLAILKDDIGTTKTLEFIANTTHIPRDRYSNVKFRVAIIQEHKEVAYDVSYIKIIK